MYSFKAECKEEIVSKFKIRNIAKQIGISQVQLYRIINNKSNASKPVAYLFTKLIDSEKEIDDFFIRVR